jgi:hypothetical protein
LILAASEADEFVHALPDILDRAERGAIVAGATAPVDGLARALGPAGRAH